MQFVLNALSVLGVVLGAVGLYATVKLAPSRRNEAPVHTVPLKPVRVWRPLQYSLALGHLKRFSDLLRRKDYYDGPDRGRVTESDLVRWCIQLALTCAAQMVPQSLGKANLFRVSQVRHNAAGVTTELSLYSSEFVGVFSVEQLTEVPNPTVLRNLRLRQDQDPNTLAAALQCVILGHPVMQSLAKRRLPLDRPEVSLGATHILAIPLFEHLHSVTERDQIVSITVDLRYSRIGRWLIEHRNTHSLHNMTVFRRARRLLDVLDAIPQLADPRFLPLSDRGEIPRRRPPLPPQPEPPGPDTTTGQDD